ncbi:MAG: shikimate dehydrogenase [Bacteroidetes bacterium]|nr:shikimate dehydrogenase [Bacteroidota bacterium]
MRKFGLVGKKLNHSFSKIFFDKKFKTQNIRDCAYQNFEISEIKHIKNIFNIEGLVGVNITNPYKEDVMQYIDALSSEAKEIGAVNCIKIEQKKIIGFNTDCFGFATSIKPFLEPQHSRALLLGSGGAAKAVAYALKQIGLDVYFVTSKQEKKNNTVFYYSELNDVIMKSFLLIVNCTPLGLFPDVNSVPNIPFNYINQSHLCYDLNYNPEETSFLKKSKENGATIINGYSMLKLQAEKSWEIWND